MPPKSPSVPAGRQVEPTKKANGISQLINRVAGAKHSASEGGKELDVRDIVCDCVGPEYECLECCMGFMTCMCCGLGLNFCCCYGC